MTYNPEAWLESTVRELKDYVSQGVNSAVLDNNSNPSGLEIYDVVMEFPGPALDNGDIPLKKTVIHFEIDDVMSQHVGMGDNIFADNYDVATQSVNPQIARRHQVNFDVGVWASALSGGLTARLRARQILDDLLGAANGQIAFRDFATGDDGYVEILNYTGGRFILDTINDVPVYRMIDGQLEVRVFSRTKLATATGPAIEEIDQVPNLTILG